MPVIPYKLQWSVCKKKGKKTFWDIEYQEILVDVNDAVAAFLEEDDQTEQRYQWKIKKQRQDAKIYGILSLDNVKGRKFLELIEDTVDPENRCPLTVLLEREFTAELYHEYSSTMSQKQYEVFKLYDQGYNKTEIASKLNIDESSVRERLHMSFRSALTAYLIHSNWDLFLSLQAELKAQFGGTMEPKKTFDRVLGFLFLNRVHLLKPSQRAMIDYALDDDYFNFINNFLDFSNPTPETPP